MMTESGQTDGIGGRVPQLLHPEQNLAMYRSLSNAIRAGIVRTAHDCSEGEGWPLRLQRCALADGWAHRWTLTHVETAMFGAVFGRILGRFVVAVSPDHEAAFLAAMKGLRPPCSEPWRIRNISITDGDDPLVHMHVDAMDNGVERHT